MALYKNGEISDIDISKLKKLAQHLNYPVNFSDKNNLKSAVSQLLINMLCFHQVYFEQGKRFCSGK
jgi:hypothetical protein